MAEILGSLTEPQTLISILAAVAVFATIITLALPALQQDELGNRMKTVAIERDRIRARERARLAEQEQRGRLKQHDESLFQNVVDKLNLRCRVDNLAKG